MSGIFDGGAPVFFSILLIVSVAAVILRMSSKAQRGRNRYQGGDSGHDGAGAGSSGGSCGGDGGGDGGGD